MLKSHLQSLQSIFTGSPFSFIYLASMLLTFTASMQVFATTAPQIENAIKNQKNIEASPTAPANPSPNEIEPQAEPERAPAEKASPKPADQNSELLIYSIRLSEEIYPSAWRKIDIAINEAEAANAAVILLELNTYGGAVDMADSIRNKLLQATPLTIAYINNNAASAGALISLACDSIYMAQHASIGAATVVNNTGQKMPDKYQSYMRAKMRATAETKNRDPLIAEAMVDERVSIPGLIDSSKILTFTATEALQYNFADGIYNNTSDLIAHLEQQTNKKAVVITHTDTWLDAVISFLMHPAVSSVLMLIMIVGLYAEIQTPGVGFPILAAAAAAFLYFGPNYLEGLASNWEIALFVVGILLILVEFFVIPGFGVAGVLGIIAFITGLSLSLIYNDAFNFSLTDIQVTDSLSSAFKQVLLTFITASITAYYLGKRFFTSSRFSKMVLSATQNTDEGYTIKKKQYENLIGKTGIVVSDLRLSGTVEIDGERYDASSGAGYIEKNVPIKVHGYQGSTIVVKPIIQRS